MEEIAPQVEGNWILRQTHVNFQVYKVNNNNKIGLTKDTIFQNLATLTIAKASPSRFSPPQARYPDFEGSIQYAGKTYPIQFYLIANSEQVGSHKGPHAFFLFGYNFPVGVHTTEAEERFLQDIGLIGENFSLEVIEGQQMLIWKGLNRGINKIELVKL